MYWYIVATKLSLLLVTLDTPYCASTYFDIKEQLIPVIAKYSYTQIFVISLSIIL